MFPRVSSSKWFQRLGRLMPSPKVWALAFAVAGLLLWLNDRFLFESVQITSSSMRPTLLPNDRAWLQKRFVGELNRFDVVVIDSRAVGHRIVKRIIGLPGETVRMISGYEVSINDEEYGYDNCGDPESDVLLEVTPDTKMHDIQVVIDPKIPPFETRYGKQDLKLGPDEFYVLGDNRLASEDSRYFGVVKREEIQGRLGRVWYSYDLQSGSFRWNRVGMKVE